MAIEPILHQHFRQEEYPLLERTQDWIERVQMRHQPQLTDFLTPRERFIITTLVHRAPEVDVAFDGGYAHAEYQRGLLMPDYWVMQDQEMALSFLQITGATQFQKLEHRDYLGALMNLGIKRGVLGDLLVSNDVCQCITTREMSAFVRVHLKQVHRVNVRVTEIERSQIRVPDREWVRQTITVSSLRLDAVLSSVYPISRSKLLPLIKSGKCKLNWKVEENPAANVESGDTLSLRGYGRASVISVEGETRKGRMRLTVGKPS